MKQYIVAAARRLGIVDHLDAVRFSVNRRRLSAQNEAFRARSPGFVTPPDSLIYETASGVSLDAYYESGKAQAGDFHRHIAAHLPPGDMSVCEWGIGAGRIIRHFSTLPGVARMVGMDYDKRMVEWCGSSLPDIKAVCNDLMPPTPFCDGEFDAAYSFSVFTHLSEAAHHAWFAELCRIVRPGGVFLFTTMGAGCAVRLLPSERAKFESGALVTRLAKREGARTYAAYESPAFVRRMVGNREILTYVPARPDVVEQDVWLVRV